MEKATGRTFVAKFIPTPSTADKIVVRNELGIMNNLHHNKLLNLHDAFDDRNEMIMVLELYVLSYKVIATGIFLCLFLLCVILKKKIFSKY